MTWRATERRAAPELDAPETLVARPPAEAVGPSDMDASPGDGPLWARWRLGGDVEARAELIARYLPYAKAVAAGLFARRSHDDVEFDDYRQLATVGLIESVDRYQPGRGALFTTFATPRIRGAVLSGLEHLSERLQQSAFRRRALSERLASLAPALRDLGRSSGLLEELGDLGVGIALGLLLEGTGMLVDDGHALPDDAYGEVELRQAHRRVWSMVGRLTERERQVLQLHYREGMRFDEVAAALRLSKGRVSQLHRQAVERLRALLRAAESCDVRY